jgi:hypothetical protein
MNTKIYSSVEFFHLQGKDPQSKTYYCYCLSPWLLYQTKFLILAPQNNSFVVSQIHHCCNSHSYVPAIAGWSSVVICRCSSPHSYQHCLVITLARSYRWHPLWWCRSPWQQVSSSLTIRSGQVDGVGNSFDCFYHMTMVFNWCVTLSCFLIAFALLFNQRHLVLEGFEYTELSPLLL